MFLRYQTASLELKRGGGGAGCVFSKLKTKTKTEKHQNSLRPCHALKPRHIFPSSGELTLSLAWTKTHSGRVRLKEGLTGQHLLSAGFADADLTGAQEQECDRHVVNRRKKGATSDREGFRGAEWSHWASYQRKEALGLLLLHSGSTERSHFLKRTSHIADSALPYPSLKSWVKKNNKEVQNIYKAYHLSMLGATLFHSLFDFLRKTPYKHQSKVHVSSQNNSSWDVINMEVDSNVLETCVWVDKRPMPNKNKGGRNSECNGGSRGFSCMNCFAVGSTKALLHRRDIHRSSIWAHLISAPMVKDESSQLHISLDSSHSSRRSAELSMSYE